MLKTLRDRMENKEFDEIIKKKLESLSSGDSDVGWKVFREKWNNTVPEVLTEDETNLEDKEVDDLFDAKLKQNLQNLRMPFNSAHWIKLKEHLEAEALFKKRLFVAKTVEILMLALIVIGVLNVWPIQKNIYQIPVYDMPMVSSIQVDQATAEKYQNDEAKKIERTAQVLKTKFVGNDLVKKISRIITPASILNATIKESTKNNSSQKNTNPTSNLESDKQSMLRFPFIESSSKKSEEEIIIRNENIFASLSTKYVNDIVAPIRPTGFPDVTILKKGDNSERSFLSLSAGPRVALVNSPFDPVYKLDPYNTFNTNFNITAKVHKEVGPVDVYTGIGFTSIDYKPLIVKETYTSNSTQFKETSLDNIKFKTVNIPIGVTYDVVDKPSFQLYASAGLDVNLIAESDYEIVDTQSFPPGSIGPAPAPSKPKGNANNVNRNSLLSQKEFSPGILSGGSLSDNLYASAHVGVGLAGKISKSTSFFVEPKYNHFISSQGIGPNQDKLHSVSIDFGVRYQLN